MKWEGMLRLAGPGLPVSFNSHIAAGRPGKNAWNLSYSYPHCEMRKKKTASHTASPSREAAVSGQRGINASFDEPCGNSTRLIHHTDCSTSWVIGHVPASEAKESMQRHTAARSNPAAPGKACVFKPDGHRAGEIVSLQPAESTIDPRGDASRRCRWLEGECDLLSDALCQSLSSASRGRVVVGDEPVHHSHARQHQGPADGGLHCWPLLSPCRCRSIHGWIRHAGAAATVRRTQAGRELADAKR